MMFTFVFLLLFVLLSLSVASVFVSFLVSLFLFLTVLSFGIPSVYYIQLNLILYLHDLLLHTLLFCRECADYQKRMMTLSTYSEE